MVQPVSNPQDPDDPDAGAIVDPTVIAERRARRAELNEGALRERAVKAESQLANAQRLLDGAHEQRKELAARLKQAERDLRAARQGEHSETQRREEIEEDAGAAQREAEQQLAALRAALAANELRVGELEDELTRVHRAATEAQQASRAALARPEPAGDDEHRRALAAAEAQLAAREQQLVTEREARTRAVRALEDERERAAAEVTLLQHELDRRMHVHETVSGQLAELRAQLTSTQARVSSDSERKAVAESVLEGLGSTALQLREELGELEDERAQLECRLTAAQAQVAQRDARLAESAERLATTDGALAQLREQLDEATAELRAATGRTQEVARQLQEERQERAQVQARLQLTILEERDAFRATVEQHRVTIQAAIAREREAFESRMASVREGVVALGERLAQTDADLDARVQAERDARLAAEQELVAAQASLAGLRAELGQVRAQSTGRAERESQLEALVNELVGTAGSLQDGFERELAAITAERDLQLAAERERFSARLADMEQRVAELRGQLAVAAEELGRQLEAERTARWAAEEQLRHERALGRPETADAADRAEVERLQALVAQQEASGARAEDRITELEDELEQARITLRPPPPMPPADHPALRDAAPADPSDAGEAGSVIIDLARAAARLRTRREEAAGAVEPDA
ncbi:MAG: hypothetical protein JWN65_3353, partial [Solirubrobacterales bacterium]|nr:hypothetical protein [Solirubrobacterales bacterium]